MDYIVFRFDVSPAQPGSDILIAFLGEMGFESFEQDDHGFNAYIRSSMIKDLVLDELQFPGFTFQWSAAHIPEKNWNAEWEKNFEPVFVDDLLCIRAPFHSIDHNCAHEIVITPKMSFGTGHHQTTRLVCRSLFALEAKNKKVLDMGCGTGILAILAARLGASKVVGIDIDQWSVDNARENCTANGCDVVEVRGGDVTAVAPGESYDIILANINRNVLLRQLPVYAQHAVKNGHLVISGFFVTDCEELISAAGKSGFEKKKMYSEGEWAALVFLRR